MHILQSKKNILKLGWGEKSESTNRKQKVGKAALNLLKKTTDANGSLLTSRKPHVAVAGGFPHTKTEKRELTVVSGLSSGEDSMRGPRGGLTL